MTTPLPQLAWVTVDCSGNGDSAASACSAAVPAEIGAALEARPVEGDSGSARAAADLAVEQGPVRAEPGAGHLPADGGRGPDLGLVGKQAAQRPDVERVLLAVELHGSQAQRAGAVGP